jgi:WD40 repeat protein
MRRIMQYGLIVCLITVLSGLVITAQDDDCPGALPSQLEIDKPAQNTPGLPANLRDSPTTNGLRIGQVPAEATVAVLEGPVCGEGYAWWRVDYEGTIGWTVEGADDYWLLPGETFVGSDDVITVWNATLLKPIRTFQGEENTAYGMAINDERSLVALGTGYPNNVIRIWNYETGEEFAVLDPGYLNDVRNLIFNTAGTRLAISGMAEDDTLIWNVNNRSVVHNFGIFTSSLAFNPEDDSLAYANFHDLTVWDTENEQELFHHEGIAEFAQQVIFANAHWLALSDDTTASLWEAQTLQPIIRMEHDFMLQDMTFTPDGKRLATLQCYEEGSYSSSCIHIKVIFWDTDLTSETFGERGQVVDVFEPGLTLYEDAQLAISPDETLLAVAESSHLWLYDLDTGRQLAVYDSFPGWQVEFTADGRYIIGAGTRAEVEVWGVMAE